ncbi:amidohydrolase family protein [Labrenzia sp. CE80]|uniref:amidohydrolase family protein n=1 Tax=Labrenzia sp. CE80 TaxID=1788986 RepID=UPI0019310E45|nr:amidohydrolase family protein [Labrenzia sp. CE80]
MTDSIRRIDAHQHFWQIARGDYDWLTPDLEPLYRDFEPKHLAPYLKKLGISGTILVQAARTEAETEFMLSLAETSAFIMGVVGWADFDSPLAPERILEMSKRPSLVGLRPMIQDIEDDRWMLTPAVSNALAAMTQAGLTFDALTLPRHLGHLLTLLRRHPDLRVIVDHGSKPDISRGDFETWADDLGAIARNTSAYCKLSGLVTEAAKNWAVEDLKPYVDHLLDVFGSNRLIWGSDWPVCTLAATYEDWYEASEHLLSDLTAAEKSRIWCENAEEAYGLGTA